MVWEPGLHRMGAKLFFTRYSKWDDPQLAKLVDNNVKYDISMAF